MIPQVHFQVYMVFHKIGGDNPRFMFVWRLRCKSKISRIELSPQVCHSRYIYEKKREQVRLNHKSHDWGGVVEVWVEPDWHKIEVNHDFMWDSRLSLEEVQRKEKKFSREKLL